MKSSLISLFLGLLLLICQMVSADLGIDLVAYYPFNGNAQDAAGNANHGVVLGPTLTNDCKIIFAGNREIADDKWHFVVGVVKRSEGGFIYINGELDNSQLLDTSVYDLSNDRNAWIGRNDVHGTEAFNGIIDDLRIYKRALSETEIQQLYQFSGDGISVVAEVSTSSGNVVIASPVSVEVTAENTTQSTAFAVLTPTATSTEVAVENSTIQIEADSLLLVHSNPEEAVSAEEQPISTLIRGTVLPKVLNLRSALFI